MQDDVSDIVKLYDSDTKREHRRLIRHQLEFDLTNRFLAGYIKPGQNVLEVGCATGRYTLELLKRGVRVTAVDFSKAMLAHSKRYLRIHGYNDKVIHYACDARDLSCVSAIKYDVVLIMGPLYHLVSLTDRRKALSQACSVLKRGGLIFSSFICRYGILGDLMKNVPQWIEETDEVESIITHGRDPLNYPRGGFRGYFANPAEIPTLHEKCGFKQVEFVAVEPAVSANDASYNRLTGKRRELWLNLLYKVAGEASTIGASRHLLYIGKKAGE